MTRIYFNNQIQGLWYNDKTKGGLAVNGDGSRTSSEAAVAACLAQTTKVNRLYMIYYNG